ncbi:hypothetical protein LJB81_03915, partial [Desulfovibrio sp. OttesenSCG-928-M14]|nr:hypothetical protein [Desulfovibrio sp. OttesenSCG-928-M14]
MNFRDIMKLAVTDPKKLVRKALGIDALRAGIQDIKEDIKIEMQAQRENSKDIHADVINTLRDIHADAINTLRDIHADVINTLRDIHADTKNTLYDRMPYSDDDPRKYMQYLSSIETGKFCLQNMLGEDNCYLDYFSQYDLLELAVRRADSISEQGLF